MHLPQIAFWKLSFASNGVNLYVMLLQILETLKVGDVVLLHESSNLYINRIVAILFLGTQTPPTILVIEG